MAGIRWSCRHHPLKPAAGGTDLAGRFSLPWLIVRSLDPIDEEIVRTLGEDGRISNAALARRVGLSPNATGVRVSRLFSSGVLSGVHARVNHAVLGKQLEVIIDCTLVDATDDSELKAFGATEERVIEALFVTGSVDHRLRAVVESTGYEDNGLSARRFSRATKSPVRTFDFPGSIQTSASSETHSPAGYCR